MSDENQDDLDALYKNRGNFSESDFERLVKKALEERDSGARVTEMTGRAIGYVVPGFLEQVKANRARAGAQSKKLKGFWAAAKELVTEQPEITPREAWAILPEYEIVDSNSDEWTFQLDESNDAPCEQLTQRCHSTNKALKRSQDWKSLSFETFRTGYIYAARRKFAPPEE